MMTDEEKARRSEKQKAIWAERRAREAAARVIRSVRGWLRSDVLRGDLKHLSPLHDDEPKPVSDPTPFDRFLASLDAETRGALDDAELRAIFAASEKKAADEKRDKLRRSAAEKALHRAKVEAGLLPRETVEQIALQAKMDELVRITPELPTDNDGRIGDAGVRLDGRLYRHGVEYTVPRGVALTIRSICWQAKMSEMDFEGKGRSHHLRRLAGALDQQI